MNLFSASRLFALVAVATLHLIVACDYGGVLPWTKWLVCLVLMSILAFALPTGLSRLPQTKTLWLAPLIPLAVWGYGYFQTLPLPSGLVQYLAPASYVAHVDWVPKEVRAEANDTETSEDVPAYIPISVAPSFTRSYLTLPAIFAVSILLGMTCLRGDRELATFLVLTAMSAGAISYMGIADRINAHDGAKFIEVSEAAQPFGPFVNRNNAAGYLNLCLGCSIAAIVLRHRKKKIAKKRDNRYALTGTTVVSRTIERCRIFLNGLDSLSIAMLVLSIAIIFGILFCGSRGGILGAVIGLTLALVRAVSGKDSFFVLSRVFAISFSIAIALGVIGLTDTFQAAFSEYFGETIKEGRIQHWRDSLSASWQYFPAGCGLGAYRFGHLPFQAEGSRHWFVNADGMPVELLLEGGIVVVGLVLAFLALMFHALWRLQNLRSSPHSSASSTMIWFVVPSLLVTQAFDFGILMPATTILLGVICGGLFASLELASQAKKTPRKNYLNRIGDDQPADNKPSALKRRMAVVLGFAVCAFVLFDSLIVQREEAMIDSVVRQVAIWKPDMISAKERIEYLAAETERLRASSPVHSELLLADATARLARNRMRSGFDKELTKAEFKTLWQTSSPEYLRYRFFQAKDRDSNDWKALLAPDQSPEDITSARRAVCAAMVACPLDDATRIRLISLDFLDNGAITPRLYEQSRILRKGSPRLLERLAYLIVVSPGGQQARTAWAQMLELTPARLFQVWSNLERLSFDIDLADIVPNDPAALVFAAEHLVKEDAALRDQLLQKFGQLTRSDSSELALGEWEVLHAKAALLRDDLINAADWYQAAIEQDGAIPLWRERYAGVLGGLGRIEQALEEYKRCARLDPANRDRYEKLMADLTNYR